MECCDQLSIENQLTAVEKEIKSVENEIQDLMQKKTELQSTKRFLRNKLFSLKENEKNACDWSSNNFKWSEELSKKLKDVFGIASLRPFQLETMNTTLSGVDCMLIMPTGGGKSLCFQLPAVLSSGLTIVISPLVSLMEDQIMMLHRLNVRAAMLTAASSKEFVNSVHRDITSLLCPIKLLYVTPEKIAKSKRFMSKLEKCYKIGALSRIAIDEVHCCSQWGHDFRPDYKILGILKRQFPKVPILGLTATASISVLNDVQKILQVPYAQVYKASFNRPNLTYRIETKPIDNEEFIRNLASLIKNDYPDQSGIVYCFSKKDTETVAEKLTKHNIKCAFYHADLSPKERSHVHTKWMQNGIQVIIATVAFGMGIDKPDVRFVIHHSVSKSMENYYQESGRAGRDNQPADCILFYRLADIFRQSCMVFTEVTGLSKLYAMLEYCLETTCCRRILIADHFSEVWDKIDCNSMCDNCNGTSSIDNLSNINLIDDCKLVYDILAKAASKDVRITGLKLIDALLGKGQTNIRGSYSTRLSRDQCEYLIAYMLVKKFIKEDFHFTPYSTISYLLPGNKYRGTDFYIQHNQKRQSTECGVKHSNDAKKQKRNGELQAHQSDVNKYQNDEIVVLDSD